MASLIAAVVWRSRAAWLALALGLVPFALGALYYGAGRWSNQGAQGIVYVGTPVLAGWAVLGGVELARRRRRSLVARSE